MEKKCRFEFLTGNQLKIIALIAMTCDHIGKELMPEYTFLQIIGRLSFPIFAYMIAEGAKYTRSRKRYFLMMAGLAVICQAVYFIAEKSLYQCILVTFSLSIVLIYAYDYWAKNKNTAGAFLVFIAILCAYFLSETLPGILFETDYMIDYGFFGIMTPLFVFVSEKKLEKLFMMTGALILVSLDFGEIQWYSLITVMLLALYNGKRGQAKMKYLFYIYYPLHLVVIYAVGLVIA